MPKPCVAEEALCTLKSNITKSKKVWFEWSLYPIQTLYLRLFFITAISQRVIERGRNSQTNRKRSRTGKKLNLSATSNSSKENWVPRLTDWLWAFKGRKSSSIWFRSDPSTLNRSIFVLHSPEYGLWCWENRGGVSDDRIAEKRHRREDQFGFSALNLKILHLFSYII